MWKRSRKQTIEEDRHYGQPLKNSSNPVDLKNSEIAIFMCIFHVHDDGERGEYMTMIKHPPDAPFISDSAECTQSIINSSNC